MKSTYLLLIFLAIVAIAGTVYIGRPTTEPKLNSSQEIMPEPTDNTIAWPPVPEGVPFRPVKEVKQVTLKTNHGDIVIALDGPNAPLTVGNFLYLAEQNFYDGTAFHRIIPDFVIQGGDPLSKDQSQRARHGTGDPGYKFPDEINRRAMTRGVLAMANSGPNTNGSQFFIVTAASLSHLDGKHTTFGVVTKGMDVVDTISKVDTDEADNPLSPVVIEDVVIHSELGEGIEIAD